MHWGQIQGLPDACQLLRHRSYRLPGVNYPEDYTEVNSMNNDYNAHYGSSLLRRINGETVLNEAKRMLLARDRRH